MKIAWFTPFTKNSAIGKYSQAITEALVKSCEVDLWLADRESLLPTTLQIFSYDRDDDMISTLSRYDFVIYNLGDNFPFHGPIYHVSKQKAGVVILHDLVMHHFFTGYYFLYLKDAALYVNEMGKLYGAAGRKAAQDSVNGMRPPVWETDEVMTFPFYEQAIAGALGVITHSNWANAKLQSEFCGPSVVLNLPLHAPGSTVAADLIGYSKRGDNIKARLNLLTVGHINPNKRIHSVLKVLAENKELSRVCQYSVIGPYEKESAYFASLLEIVEENGLNDSVSFLGYLPDGLLHQKLGEADICINLRFPAMEAASWSAVEKMYFGKPVVVTDTGFYSELPDNTVIKIDPRNEEGELKEALTKLVRDAALRKTIGENARQFVVDECSVKGYCEKFCEFIMTVRDTNPILELIDKASRELKAMGIGSTMECVETVAAEISMMAKSSPEPELFCQPWFRKSRM